MCVSNMNYRRYYVVYVKTMLITLSYICYSAVINMWPTINEPSRRRFTVKAAKYSSAILNPTNCSSFQSRQTVSVETPLVVYLYCGSNDRIVL
jgi:hypothetical protein